MTWKRDLAVYFLDEAGIPHPSIQRRRTCDPKCYGLAVEFLDERGIGYETARRRLAAAIQGAIDDFIREFEEDEEKAMLYLEDEDEP